MTQEEFINLVRDMRKAQKEYFKTRDYLVLNLQRYLKSKWMPQSSPLNNPNRHHSLNNHQIKIYYEKSTTYCLQDGQRHTGD